MKASQPQEIQAAFCPTAREMGAVLLPLVTVMGRDSFSGRPSDDLSLVPARLEALQGSSHLDHYTNTSFTTKAWCLWAGAALANDTELTGMNQDFSGRGEGPVLRQS